VSSTQGTTDYISGIQYKSNSTVIDFIQTEEGRVLNPTTTPNYEYTLTDHLGNNRVTFDQVNGKTSEDDYYPFGLNVPKLANSTNLYLYNKKELQQELSEYDYGARFYDPVIARWTTVDPLAEKNRRFSPYDYGNDNPIRNIDRDGMISTDVTQNSDGTYNVVSAKADGDKNVYVDNTKGQRTGQVIGKTLTDHSFLADNGKAVTGATINLSDKSGANFLNNKIIGNKDLSLTGYMHNARGGQAYDFKTNGPNGQANWMKGNVAKSDQADYMYRGMPVNSVPGLGDNSGVPLIATARDIGNVGAGYVAGSNGLSWNDARMGFDALQSYQDGKPSTEGQTTQLAEKAGYNLGTSEFAHEHPFQAIFQNDDSYPAH